MNDNAKYFFIGVTAFVVFIGIPLFSTSKYLTDKEKQTDVEKRLTDMENEISDLKKELHESHMENERKRHYLETRIATVEWKLR